MAALILAKKQFALPPCLIYFYCLARLKCALQIFYACQLALGGGGWWLREGIWAKYVYLTHLPHSHILARKGFPSPLYLFFILFYFAYRIKVFLLLDYPATHTHTYALVVWKEFGFLPRPSFVLKKGGREGCHHHCHCHCCWQSNFSYFAAIEFGFLLFFILRNFWA